MAAIQLLKFAHLSEFLRKLYSPFHFLLLFKDVLPNTWDFSLSLRLPSVVAYLAGAHHMLAQLKRHGFLSSFFYHPPLGSSLHLDLQLACPEIFFLILMELSSGFFLSPSLNSFIKEETMIPSEDLQFLW